MKKSLFLIFLLNTSVILKISFPNFICKLSFLFFMHSGILESTGNHRDSLQLCHVREQMKAQNWSFPLHPGRLFFLVGVMPDFFNLIRCVSFSPSLSFFICISFFQGKMTKSGLCNCSFSIIITLSELENKVNSVFLIQFPQLLRLTQEKHVFFQSE